MTKHTKIDLSSNASLEFATIDMTLSCSRMMAFRMMAFVRSSSASFS